MSDGDFPVVLFSNGIAMGGMEQHVEFLAAGCAARGIRTALVCSSAPGINRLRDDLRSAGVEIHTPSERSGIAGGIRRVRELRAIFEQYTGGILHLHSTGYHGGDLVMLAGRLGGMEAIVRTEHVPPQPPFGLLHRAGVRSRDRLLTSRVVCVSDGNRREHAQLLGRDERKLVVIPNGIDVDRFIGGDGRSVRREFGLGDDVPVVGVVGRLAEERKGLQEFLQMAAAATAADRNVRFWIVGEGPLRESFERRAAELDVDERVSFLGARGDVADVLAALDVFVMPSLWEAGPLTLLEAMTAGCAVVTTSVGIAPDVIEVDVNGLMVPPGDVTALTHAVLRLLADPDRARELGAAAASGAKHTFSITTMIDRTIDLYRASVGV